MEYTRKNQFIQDLLKVDEKEIQRKFQERLLCINTVSDKRRQEIQDKFKEKLSLITTEPPPLEKGKCIQMTQAGEQESLEELMEELDKKHGKKSILRIIKSFLCPKTKEKS